MLHLCLVFERLKEHGSCPSDAQICKEVRVGRKPSNKYRVTQLSFIDVSIVFSGIVGSALTRGTGMFQHVEVFSFRALRGREIFLASRRDGGGGARCRHLL